jgi:hypothetical protein
MALLVELTEADRGVWASHRLVWSAFCFRVLRKVLITASIMQMRRGIVTTIAIRKAAVTKGDAKSFRLQTNAKMSKAEAASRARRRKIRPRTVRLPRTWGS